MSARRWLLGPVAVVVVLRGLCALAQAPQSTVLPPPEPVFKGEIGTTYKDSVMDKIPILKAPEGAPNVLFILVDDAGFGQAGTFGGQIPTPALDRLAKDGLRYTRYHTTALCSPTRAALLTGRNHHSCASGNITEMADSFPGYSSVIPKSCAMVPEILRQNGFNTACFGKWHNTPVWETSMVGPYDRWPTGLGFERFYGFMGGESGQWQPALYDQTTPVEMEVPKGMQGRYTLNDALASKCIDWIHQQKSIAPEKPFFVYYAPGATHAPHHVPKEWMEKFRGQFDQGWDQYREEAYQRQLKLGVIPPDCKLTPRPAEIPAWDSLTPDQKRVASRLMEAFAAYTAQTDYEVGRILDSLQAMGQLDNTLVFYEIGDNGSSMEGKLHGLFNEMIDLNGLEEDPAFVQKHIDDIGGPKAYNHFPVGWAWAMNTPFQWGKQIASHLGGTRNPIVISWPKRISDKGGVRTQFHHCIDVVPTILEACGIKEPTEVNGVPQKPIEGVSMVYSFGDAKAKSPRKTQYFEMFGNRALYSDGWIACCRHGRLPWVGLGTYSFDDDKWELYNLEEDFSEANDLAAKHPRRLKDLQDLFWVEAAKHDVLPLDDRFTERLYPGIKPSLTEDRKQFVYYEGASRISEFCSANTCNKSFTITADLDVPKSGAEGVIVATGGCVGGYSLYVKEGRPAYQYNLFSVERFTIASSEKLPPGPCTLRFEFDYDGGGLGRGGTCTLFINGKHVGEGRIEHTAPAGFSATETFDTGRDTGSPAADAYESPFPFSGAVKKVVIDVVPPKLTAQNVKAVQEMNQRRATAAE